jgi:hypothetical protein
MFVHIEVTAEDLRDGDMKSTSDCPVARAIKRALPGRSVIVGVFRAYTDEHRCDLPHEVSDLILGKITGDLCEPFGADLIFREQ